MIFFLDKTLPAQHGEAWLLLSGGVMWERLQTNVKAWAGWPSIFS